MSRARLLSAALVTVVTACAGPTAAPPSAAPPSGALSSIAVPSHLETIGLNAPTFDRAADLAAALTSAGVSCDVSGPVATAGEVDRARCRAGNDDIVIRVFADTGARNRYLAQSTGLLGQASIEPVPQLAGPNWLVSSDTEATIERIRQAVGGEIVR